MKDNQHNHGNWGFSLIELLIVVAIMAIITTIILIALPLFNKSQALDKDKETVIETLQQARSQTLSSKNANQYGVHFSSSQIVLFTGANYSSSDPNNLNYPLNSFDTILTISLTGGGSDVIFNRLTGETSQNGTIVLSSSSTGNTKTVTIYATGLIESN